MRKFVACFTFVLVCVAGAMAQSKQAEEADEAFNKGFFYNAIEMYKKAYTTEKKAGEKAVLIFKVAQAYRALGDGENAQVWYEKANKAQYPDPITYYYIGEALKEQGKYADAIAAYNKYKEKNPGDMRADASLASCQLAQTWKDTPSRYKVDPEVLLNSPQYDFSAAFSDKRNTDVVFVSSRPAATGTESDGIVGESFTDLFASSRDKLGKWSEPVRLEPNINTAGAEGSATFNNKRNMMYFTRCPHEKKKAFGCDIWVSKKVGNNYSDPVMLPLKPEQGKKDTTMVTIGQPTLSKDETLLVFASNMNGGQGGKDLWKVGLDKNGMPTGAVTNLGKEINTPKDEMFPFLRDNGDLYFSSNGITGMGGMDIFHAEKTGDATWGHVENMKSPMNSSGDDFSIIFDGDEERGFFTSNRPGGKGEDDIWRFYVPDLVFALQGVVKDKVTGDPLQDAKVEVVGTDGSNFNALTDENGGFNFEENGKDRYINENTSYTVRASKAQYLVVNDQITTVGLTESTTFVKEYLLQPVAPDKAIALPEVLFDLGSAALRPEGKDSLQTLYQTLVDNATIIIELAAHTDSRGSDKSNITLSQNRAQSCVNYLISKGIDPARMVAKGYGETRPRITDAEIAKMATTEEKEAAHQKNRRVEFTVKSFDFVPKANEPMVPESN
ncbi:MAG: OmpA family protein [Flavobacteriales bacterium]|nr:OmpA family protein [Flavobacteriales bacterium]MBK9059147.1 OmpA family protein [Flavobacteriales bacterium]MBK9597916.1 OmpA family protein [Flavobacteriales bacterium]QQS73880.1 MAG: OmpA family protein [Flavobacteriales bacterium]HQV39005.1 OmpA family protein [Flavobacteriales bacterium]